MPKKIGKTPILECYYIPVGTRYCSDIGFSLGFHRDVDQLRTEIEVTWLYEIFFQHHNDLVAIT